MILECIDNVLSHFYRPQTKLRKGNVFTPVSYSVHRAGCLPQCMLGYTPPADTPQGRPPAADGHCSGRYASYWNAFLFGQIICNVGSFAWFRNTSVAVTISASVN